MSTKKPICQHCGAPYEKHSRGCCLLCYQTQLIIHYACIVLPPGKDRK